MLPNSWKHTLRHVEDATLILVSDVLTPEEGVGIVTELLLEGLVESLYQV